MTGPIKAKIQDLTLDQISGAKIDYTVKKGTFSTSREVTVTTKNSKNEDVIATGKFRELLKQIDNQAKSHQNEWGMDGNVDKALAKVKAKLDDADAEVKDLKNPLRKADLKVRQFVGNIGRFSRNHSKTIDHMREVYVTTPQKQEDKFSHIPKGAMNKLKENLEEPEQKKSSGQPHIVLSILKSELGDLVRITKRSDGRGFDAETDNRLWNDTQLRLKLKENGLFKSEEGYVKLMDNVIQRNQNSNLDQIRSLLSDMGSDEKMTIAETAPRILNLFKDLASESESFELKKDKSENYFVQFNHNVKGKYTIDSHDLKSTLGFSGTPEQYNKLFAKVQELTDSNVEHGNLKQPLRTEERIEKELKESTAKSKTFDFEEMKNLFTDSQVEPLKATVAIHKIIASVVEGLKKELGENFIITKSEDGKTFKAKGSTKTLNNGYIKNVIGKGLFKSNDEYVKVLNIVNEQIHPTISKGSKSQMEKLMEEKEELKNKRYLENLNKAAIKLNKDVIDFHDSKMPFLELEKSIRLDTQNLTPLLNEDTKETKLLNHETEICTQLLKHNELIKAKYSNFINLLTNMKIKESEKKLQELLGREDFKNEFPAFVKKSKNDNEIAHLKGSTEAAIKKHTALKNGHDTRLAEIKKNSEPLKKSLEESKLKLSNLKEQITNLGSKIQSIAKEYPELKESVSGKMEELDRLQTPLKPTFKEAQEETEHTIRGIFKEADKLLKQSETIRSELKPSQLDLVNKNLASFYKQHGDKVQLSTSEDQNTNFIKALAQENFKAEDWVIERGHVDARRFVIKGPTA